MDDRQHHQLCASAGAVKVQDPHGVIGVQAVAATVALALQVRLLKQDVGAGRAVPTAVGHFHLVQVAGALGEVAKLGEVPAGGRLLLRSLLATSETAAPWLLHSHLALGTGEEGAVLGADTPPTDAAAALTGLLPLGSRRVGMPVMPALATVPGHAGTRLAAEVPPLAHAAWDLPRTAVALSLCGVGLPARLLAEPQLPGGQLLLPHFPGGALLTVSEGAAEGPILADTAAAVLGEYSPWGQLPGLLFESQGEAPGQRELGAGAGGGGHTRAIVKQLPSRAVTAQLAGFLRAEGARLQVRAEAWAGGGTGAEQLARWALRAGPQVTFLLLLRVLGLARRTAGTLLAAPMPLGGAPTTGSRAVAPG